MLILASACLAAAYAAAYGLIPWAGRHAMLYALHGLRDQLYEVGERPEVRSTLLYRDMEFLFCLCLNRLRAGDGEALDIMFRGMLASKLGDDDGEAVAIYERDVITTQDLERLVALMDPLRAILGASIFLLQPRQTVALVATSPFVLGAMAIRVVTVGAAGPLSRLSRAVGSAMSLPESMGTPQHA